MREVADILEMPYTDVYEVVTFYSLLYEYPVGKWVLQVCDDNPCCFTGAEELVDDLEQRLGIKAGEMSDDRICDAAARQVPGRVPSGAAAAGQSRVPLRSDARRVPGLLEDLARKAESGEPLSVSGRFAEQ